MSGCLFREDCGIFNFPRTEGGIRLAFSWQVWLAVAQCDAGQEIQAIGAERAAVTVQSLIEEAEQARIKAMESPNGAAAAVSAITAEAKLAGLWREKVDQHSTGIFPTPVANESRQAEESEPNASCRDQPNRHSCYMLRLYHVFPYDAENSWPI